MSESWTLVTGAAKGLGAAISLSLAKQGYALVLHYRESKQEVEKVAVSCRAMGVEARIIEGDFNTVDSTQRFIDSYLAQFPNTRGLVNNVGMYHLSSITSTDEQTWQMLFQVNVHAPRALMSACVPSLRRYEGSIVNIGMAGIERFYPDIHSAAYMATKTVLWQITRSLARQMAPDRVRVNMVSPGYLERSDVKPAEDRLAPMGRLASLDEVAKLVAYLMGADSTYVTGQNIEVAGGTRL